MGFRSFEPAMVGTPLVFAPERRVAGERPATQLMALEWSVIALARGDRLATLRAPDRYARTIGLMFGRKHNPCLANTRLEQLRRVAVLLWRKPDAMPGAERQAFLDAGFTQEQYQLVATSIDRSRRSAKPVIASRRDR